MPTRPQRRQFLQLLGLSLASPAWGLPVPRPKGDPADFVPLPLDEDLTLPTGVRRLGTTRLRTAGNINAVRIAPDGRAICAAEGDEVRGWSSIDGKPIFRLKYPDGPRIDSGRLIEPFGMVVLVGSDKMEFRFYELPSGRIVHRSGKLPFQNVGQVMFARDGSHAAIILRNELLMLECRTGKELWRLAPNDGDGLGGFEFVDATGELLMTRRQAIQVYDARTGKLKRAHRVEATKKEGGKDRYSLENLAPSTDGRWLAATVELDDNDDSQVAIWKGTDEKQSWIVKADRPVAFMPDGSQLITKTGRRLAFWDLKTGNKLREFDGVAGEVPQLTPDGRLLADESFDAVTVIDVKTGQFVPFSADPPGSPQKLDFRNGKLQGELLHWGGWVEWDLTSGAMERFRPVDPVAGNPIGVTRDRKHLVFVDGVKATSTSLAAGAKQVKFELGFSNGGRHLALSRDSGTMVELQVDAVAITQLASGQKTTIEGYSFNADHQVLVSDDGTIAVSFTHNDDEQGNCEAQSFDLVHRTRLARMTAEGSTRTAALSDDGSLLVLAMLRPGGRGGEQTGLTMFQARTGRVVCQVPPEDRQITALAISPCSRFVARADFGKKLSIWEVASGQARQRFDVVGDPTSMAFSPDGRTLAMNGRGGPVLLWPIFTPPSDKAPPVERELDAIWTALGGRADEAFDAIRRLVHQPAEATKLLKERLSPVEAPDPKQVQAWIDDLDHDVYRQRERAMKALANLGERARGALEAAMEVNRAPERRDRLVRLLSASEQFTPDRARQIRAVEVLERANTPESRQLLIAWSKGAPGARLTREAQSALSRLGPKVGD